MTENETHLLRDMEMFRKMRGSPPEGYEYSGMQDFLVREGTWYTPSPLPQGVRRGVPKGCYGNALTQAILRGWTYVEGLAIPDIGVPLPMQHAWNVTPEGVLVDNTWDEVGLAYIGVPFSIGRADRVIWGQNETIFENISDRFAIYKNKWQGEDWDKVWRKSQLRRFIERQRAPKQRKTVLGKRRITA